MNFLEPRFAWPSSLCKMLPLQLYHLNNRLHQSWIYFARKDRSEFLIHSYLFRRIALQKVSLHLYLYLLGIKAFLLNQTNRALYKHLIFTLWRCKNSSFSIASCSRSLYKTFLFTVIKLISVLLSICGISSLYKIVHIIHIKLCHIGNWLIFSVWYHEIECKRI